MTDITKIRELYPFKSNFMTINDHQYHYLNEGKGSPVVMVHGNPTWSFFFRNLVKRLSVNHQVIVPDHMGCGLSDKPQKYLYRLETHVENLENLLTSLKLENITLIVHDWGGAIGMGFAMRHSDLIKRIVIMNSAAFSFNWIPLRIALCRIPLLDDILVRKANVFVRAAQYMTTVKPIPDLVKLGYRLPYNNYANRIAILRFVQDIPMSPDDVSFEPLLEIEHGLWMFRGLPIAIIWGMKDWCFSPKILKRWKIYYPEAEIHELEHAGHYLMEDAGDEIDDIVEDFLQRYP
ncbi:MAG: alpha/beta fold hydrolase [Victivallaceae bacterium]|nr:alpha/beta fold hydrolase [Victivallaceae bacterium]